MSFEQPGSTLTIVPAEPAALTEFPVVLPDHIQAIMDAFDDGPDGNIAQLRTLMTMDACYQDNDPRLSEVRQQQAEGLQTHLEHTANAIRYNKFFLGFLLIFANNNQLHSYLGYPNLTSWCQSINIRDEVLIQEAMELASVHAFLHGLGYSVEDVVDGSITPGVKAKCIKGLANKALDELVRHQIEVLRETHTEIAEHAQLEHAPKKNKRALVQGVIDSLPVEEQASLRSQVEARYIQEARNKVEQIRILGEGDLVINQQVKYGKPQPPLICLDVEWRDGTCFFSAGSFPCALSQVVAMTKNQYDLRFAVEDIEGIVTLKQLGDHLAVFVKDDDEEDDNLLY